MACATPVAQAMRGDVEDVAAFYVSLYRSTPAAVTVTVGADGVLSAVAVSADMSAIFELMFDPEAGIDFGGTPAQLADAREQFAGTVWQLQQRITFQLDPTIAVTPPTGDLEDRTQLAAEFLAAMFPADR